MQYILTVELTVLVDGVDALCGGQGRQKYDLKVFSLKKTENGMAMTERENCRRSSLGQRYLLNIQIGTRD